MTRETAERSPRGPVRAVLSFIKTTLVGGLFFLLPLVVAVFLLQKAIQVVAKVLHPVASHLPIASVVGIGAADVLAALLLVGVGFLAGLLGRTGLGSRIHGKLEQLILRKMPGYTLLKGAAGAEGSAEVEVALARFDDNTVLGFIMEKSADGLLTVFVPSAPTPAAGTVFYLTEDRVQRLDVPVAAASKVIMRLGIGSKDLLEKKKPH
jgi:uncharacterized membrane protein